MIIATGPKKTRSTNKAETAVPLKGEATESNGFNCTLGPSGFANPCIARKSGAVRFKETVVEKRTGEPKTLYLNVLAGAKPLLAETVRSDEPGLARVTAGGPHRLALRGAIAPRAGAAGPFSARRAATSSARRPC